MDPEILHERIERYLGHTLDPAELTAFEQELVSDTALQAEVERHRKAAAALKYGLQTSRRAQLQHIEHDLGTGRRRVLFSLPRLAAAASVLIILAAGIRMYVHHHYSPNVIAERMFAPTPHETFRGQKAEQGAVDTYFAEAETFFRHRDFDQARQRYLLIIKEDTLLKERAEWDLLLCYFAMDPASPQFGVLLKRITQDPNHAFHAPAVHLQTLMQSRWYRLSNS